MKTLLLDDIRLHTKYIFASLITCIILYPIFYLDRDVKSLLIGLILTVFIVFNITVGKLCSEKEDGLIYKDMEDYNKKIDIFILVGFLEGFFVILTSMIIIAIENCLVKTFYDTNLYFNTQELFYCLSLSIILIGVFFFLYYKYSYKFAIQSTCFILLIAMFGIKFVVTQGFSIVNFFNFNYSYFITFVLALIIYIILYKVCVYLYRVKHN